MSWDDPEFDFAVDVLGQIDLDRVQPQFLERTLDPDILRIDLEAFAAQGRRDLIDVDRAVKVSFGVGIGLDRQRALGDLGSQVLQIGACASSSSLSRWRCFSIIRRLFGVANVPKPCGTR